MNRPVDHPTQPAADPEATTGGSEQATITTPALTSPERYLLGEEIARGGMGEVYRATDTVLNREVAVKVLQAKYAPESVTARRFADEARITARLQHPGIPPVHDLGTLPDGRPFLAMKLIKGNTLDDELKARPGPAADRGRWVAAFEKVCEAVAYAHAHGVIHRDLKPANVMVGAFGEVQVMDWGLAKVLGDDRPSAADDPDATAAGTAVGTTRDSEDLLTQAGSVLGTPAYMPPEQAVGAVHEVDRRSDVFGLGGILAAVLTGRPPFIGDTAETTRVQAARGEVQGCFARLDECEADPGLVALAKRCLAPGRDDRPADAEAVAAEVAALRAAADDRVRQAEVDLATAATTNAERRKRRRVWLGATAALAVAVVGGLGAVLVVQRRANADLNARNEALEAERAKVEQRFEMARKAIAAFHTTIDEQPELGNEAFRPLRKKLLTAAAGFYRELEVLLADESDPRSRAALADGYFQLAELTAKIGDKTEALAVFRKALAIRRESAAAPGADADARLAVSVTVLRVGSLLADTGDTAGALRACEEARDVAAALEAEAPTDAATRVLASSHFGIGVVLRDMDRPGEALAAHQKARDLRQKLADAHPDDPGYQSKLADSFNNIGNLLRQNGQPAEALAAHQKARDLRQKLADAHPTVTEHQSDLAQSHDNIAGLLDLPAEKLATRLKARVLRQKLADAHPAVTQFQSDLADSHHNIGIVLDQSGKPAEALAAFEKARDLEQKLADTNPTVTEYQNDLASSYTSIGIVLDRSGKPAEALASHQRAREVRQKLADAHPTVVKYQSDLASTHSNIGRLLAKEGRFPEAFAALDAGLAIREKLVAADPKTTRYANHLGFSHAYRGWARVRAGQPKEAAADLRTAGELWAKDPAPNSQTRFEKARALALLAKLGAEAKSGVTADEGKAFADLAMAALADAIKAGSSQLKELREPDFDAIRDREDFRMLVADPEAKAAKPREVAPPPREKT
jgi:tetratricopeptide (TPR) repeat protein/tRNA A-37 threonylcarbamoyl transferase component Bud32